MASLKLLCTRYTTDMQRKAASFRSLISLLVRVCCLLQNIVPTNPLSYAENVPLQTIVDLELFVHLHAPKRDARLAEKVCAWSRLSLGIGATAAACSPQLPCPPSFPQPLWHSLADPHSAPSPPELCPWRLSSYFSLLPLFRSQDRPFFFLFFLPPFSGSRRVA